MSIIRWPALIVVLCFLVFAGLGYLLRSPLVAQLDHEVKEPLIDRSDGITIGILQDGPSPALDEVVKATKKEFDILHSSDEGTEVTFKQLKPAENWSIPALQAALEEAFKDPKIDMILGVGALVTQMAAQPVIQLEKPVVTALIQRSEIFSLPINEQGYSDKENLVFTVVNLPVTRDIKAFKDLVGFKKLVIVVDANVAGNLSGFQRKIRDFEKRFGIKIQVVKAGASASGILKHLSSSTPAVMLTLLPSLSAGERKKLINGINRKRISSFSLLGHPDVDKGVMAGLVPNLMQETARGTALQLSQVIKNYPLDEMTVFTPVKTQLIVNAKTARKVGFSPTLEALRTMNIANWHALRRGSGLLLNEALKIGGEFNIDNYIQKARLMETEQDSLIARSRLFPQVVGSINYTQIDRDRAVGSGGFLPQRATTGNIGINQLLYDDATVQGYRSSRREVKAAEFAKDSVRLDSMATAGVRFSELLSANSLLTIASENLNLTLDQLELAHLRYELGMSGKDEVYRWEAQESQQRAAVFSRYAELQAALYALNQSLNDDIVKPWNPVDISYKKISKYFLGPRAAPLLKTVGQIKKFSGFLVERALDNSPELKTIYAQADAQGIQLEQKKRAYFVPTVSTDFNYSNELQATRPGVAAGTPNAAENAWQFGMGLRLPLFEGLRRSHDVNRTKAIIKRLEAELTRSAQIIEQNVNTVLQATQSSYINLGLAKNAEEKAKLNFDIVQLKYSQGLVGIIDMLDAQNEYVTRQEQLALTIYGHLNNLIRLQRAVSWFVVDHTEDEKRDFQYDFLAYTRER